MVPFPTGLTGPFQTTTHKGFQSTATPTGSIQSRCIMWTFRWRSHVPREPLSVDEQSRVLAWTRSHRVCLGREKSASHKINEFPWAVLVILWSHSRARDRASSPGLRDGTGVTNAVGREAVNSRVLWEPPRPFPLWRPRPVGVRLSTPTPLMSMAERGLGDGSFYNPRVAKITVSTWVTGHQGRLGRLPNGAIAPETWTSLRSGSHAHIGLGITVVYNSMDLLP